MALASAIQGAKRPTQQITWTRQGSGDPEVLTGATITGIIKNKQTLETRAITGTLTVTDGENGVFTWAYGTADVADAGVFQVQFSAAFIAEPTPAKTFLTDWEVKTSPTVSE